MGRPEKRMLGKRKNNEVSKLALTVICGLVGIGSLIANESSKPKLVVGIMIDQLRSDYIDYLQNYFGEKGFKRLLKDGVYLQDVDFKVPGLDKVSGTALIYTGNYPRYNGITSSKVYSPAAKDMVFALNDPKSLGNFTSETFSPVNLRLSTISDEIAIDGKGETLIYSIAPDAQQAIVMAGHAGTSAHWINENTGNWASTTYYIDNPMLLIQKNYNNPIKQRLDTMVWQGKDFQHTFPQSDRNVYRMYASSPMINREMTDAAISYIEELNLGKGDKGTDMLNIAYTVEPYKYDGGTDFRAELEDSYIQLDNQLGRLFDAIEKNVGMDEVLVYVSSTGYFDDSAEDDAKFHTPTGTFSVKRALSLLNSFLVAHYGNGSYVDTYSDRHIYLDRKGIEEKNLNLREVAELSRDFLVKMSGVNDAFTMSDIMSSTLPSMEGFRLGTDPKTGGDIILEFNAGWKVVDDTRFPNETKIARATPVLTPVFFMGLDIVPERVEETVDAVAIAPTLAQTLRIRAPNGSSSKPLNLKRKN